MLPCAMVFTPSQLPPSFCKDSCDCCTACVGETDNLVASPATEAWAALHSIRDLLQSAHTDGDVSV